MSWQAYVDNQICASVSTKIAIIASLQEGAIWASKIDSSIPVKQEEIKLIADMMKNGNQSQFLNEGIKIGNDKYFCLLAEPNLVRGRKGACALLIYATRTTLIIVVTTDGFPPGHLNTVVEGLGEYLVGKNF